MTDTAVIQVKPGIGDTLWHLPFVRAIAGTTPGGQVIFYAPPRSQARELLAAEPSVAETVYFEHGGNELRRGLNLIRLVRLLRARHLQRIWILDRTTRPAVAARLAGIPQRIGIGLGAQTRWITNAGIDASHFHDHPIGWLKALMARENVPLASTEPALVVPQAAREAVAARFGGLRRPRLVLGLGASHPSRYWPDGHWRELLRLLRVSAAGSVVFIGGPGFAARADRLIAESGTGAVNACDLPVIQAAALLAAADLYAGPDSGPLNLAGAVGTQAIGLFGKDPPLTHTRFVYPLRAAEEGAHSIDRIPPESVMAAIVERLAGLSVRG